MAALNDCVGFQTQIASIMEALANTAVAEICKLVDDGYDILRLEIDQERERIKNENLILKRKLHIMELKVAQVCDDGSGGRYCRVEVDVCDQSIKTTRENDYAFSQSGEKRRRVKLCLDPPVTIEEDESQFQCIGRKTNLESLCIKEEITENDMFNKPQRTEHQNIGRDGAMETFDGSGRVTTAGTQSVINKSTEDQHEPHNTIPDTTLKSEPDVESVASSLVHTGSEPTTERMTGQEPNWPVSQSGPLFTQGCGSPETEDPSCSYGTETTAGNWPVEFPYAPDISELAYCEPRATGSKPAEPRQKDSPSSKRFTCKYCSKVFAKKAPLVSHERVHTGEKPFRCAQCGKQFSHAGNLKMHQRIHTGERPFSCFLCGKRFVSSSDCKKHMRVHSRERACDVGGYRAQPAQKGERLFTCLRCGKCFSHSWHFKKHLQLCH